MGDEEEGLRADGLRADGLRADSLRASREYLFPVHCFSVSLSGEESSDEAKTEKSPRDENEHCLLDIHRSHTLQQEKCSSEETSLRAQGEDRFPVTRIQKEASTRGPVSKKQDVTNNWMEVSSLDIREIDLFGPRGFSDVSSKLFVSVLVAHVPLIERNATTTMMTFDGRSERAEHSTTTDARRVNLATAVRISALHMEPTSSRAPTFSGNQTTGQSFSVWLRRIEDIIRVRSATATSKEKASFIIVHLEGQARDKIDELDDAAREEYDQVIAHLRAAFEGPQQRNLARQSLRTCKQEVGESVPAFAARLVALVRAATSHLTPAAQKERSLEEFISKIRPNLRCHVKMEEPTTLEQAISKATLAEQILAEMATEKLTNRVAEPSSSTAALVKFMMGSAASSSESSSFSSQTSDTPSGNSEGPICFGCGGRGHMRNDCPTVWRQNQEFQNSSWQSSSQQDWQHQLQQWDY